MMTQNETINSNKNIVFFDGVCNLCNNAVDWLILRDQNKTLLYASLQGETAKKSLTSSELQNLSSIIVVTEKSEVLRQSKAVFYLLRKVNSPAKILLIFSLLPTFLTDLVYDFIAKNRLSWFGKRNSCRIPNNQEKSLFLP